GFSLWGLVLARPKPHRLKPALLNPSMARRMKKEFLISFRALQMARTNAFHMQSGSERSLPNALNGAFMQRSVAHDAAAADISTVEFKLRLDQDQVLRAG